MTHLPQTARFLPQEGPLRTLPSVMGTATNRLFRNVLVLTVFISVAQALAGPVMTAIGTQGLAQAALNLFDISVAIWLALAVTLHLLLKGPPVGNTTVLGWSCLAMAAIWLVPSATVMWLSLALFALIQLPGSTGETRTGLVVTIALAIREPLTSLALGLFASPMLAADAILMSALLELLGHDPVRTGNIVEAGGGMELLVLTGCSSFSNVSLALLAWFALIKGRSVRNSWHVLLTGLWLCISVIATNVLRLSLMSNNSDFYAWIHDGPGILVFQLATCLLVVGAVWASMRHEH